MQKEQKYVGTYRVRRLSKMEQAIHVPSNISGDFALYVEHDGTMVFCPIGKKGDEKNG